MGLLMPSIRPHAFPLLALLAGLGLGLGCGGAASRQQRGASGPPGPVVIPAVRASVTWQEPVDRAAGVPDPGEGVPVAFGVARALVRTQEGIFAVHASEGVIGRVPLPDGVRWVGLDGRDALWFAGRGGEVFVAEVASKVEAARKVLTLPDAVAWDVTRGLAVAAAGEVVHVSEDRGATWRQVVPRAGVTIRAVAARWDGVIVAQGVLTSAERPGLVTLVSRDRGARWEVATFQPAGVLRRDGGWIWSGDLSCPATLSADGVTWSSDPHVERSPGLADPRPRWLVLTSTARGLHAEAFGRLDSPPPAADPKQRHVGTTTTCQDPILSPRRVKPPATRGQLPPPCAGGRCLRGTSGDAPEPTRHGFWLFADGACASAHAAEDGSCRPGAPWTRAPHVALIDHDARQLTTLQPPAACHPDRLWTVRGMAVLLCRTDTGGRALYTRASNTDASWVKEREEARPAEDLQRISSASDGTIVLHGACPDDPALPCAPSLLRRPDAPTPSPAAEVARRWVVLDRPHLVTARALSGGRALLATASTKDPERLVLWLAAADAPAKPRRLVTLGGLSHPARDLRVEEGKIMLRLGDAMQPPAYIVRADGALLR